VRYGQDFDEWSVLGEQTTKAVDQGVDIKSQGGRMSCRPFR
jgi:hypothetical protein